VELTDAPIGAGGGTREDTVAVGGGGGGGAGATLPGGGGGGPFFDGTAWISAFNAGGNDGGAADGGAADGGDDATEASPVAGRNTDARGAAEPTLALAPGGGGTCGSSRTFEA
jgi:hypothetical protein